MDERIWLRAADIDLVKLVDDIAHGKGADTDIDIRVASVLEVFARYMCGLDGGPDLIRLSLNEFLHGFRDPVRVDIKILSPHGKGGLIYRDDLPPFTESMDAVLRAGKALGIENGSWTVDFASSESTAVIRIPGEGIFSGLATSPVRALLAAMISLVEARR